MSTNRYFSSLAASPCFVDLCSEIHSASYSQEREVCPERREAQETEQSQRL